MKNSILLTLCIIIFSLAGICWVHRVESQKQNQVVISENMVMGDPLAAEGITVELSTHYDYHLFWDTSYVVGSGEPATTEFSFSSKSRYQLRETEFTGVGLYPYLSSDLDLTKVDDRTGLDLAFYQLYQQAQPGQELEAVINLADYYDYYPVAVTLDLPNCKSEFCENYIVADGINLGPTIISFDGTDTGYYRLFTDYFKIPVLESETLSIDISRHVDNNVYSAGYCTTDSDRFYLNTINVLGRDQCFLVFDAHSEQGEVVDTSQLPDGYGIFAIPCYTDEYGATDIDPGNIRMVYSLDPQVRISNLLLSSDGESLLLFTVESGQLMLTVVDTESFATLEKLSICQLDSDDAGCDYHIHGDLIVICHGSELSVIFRQPEGYRLEYTIDSYLKQDDIIYPDPYIETSAAMDYDSETGRLLISDAARGSTELWHRTADFYVAVYDKTGMIYYGSFGSSLNTTGSVAVPVSEYDRSCLPTDNDYISARFG